MVRIQAQMIRSITVIFSARGFLPKPTPMIAVEMLCVVDTGIPKWAAVTRIVADAADKPAVATQAGDTYRHIGRCAAGTLQQATAAFRQQVHYRIPKHPNFCIHTVFTSMLNLIKPV